MEFGPLLKDWRQQRRMSQMDLGLTANVSSRHISFLETGRAKPSRVMVIQLSETLGIPRDQRNRLLTAAGYSAAYRERALTDLEMEPVLKAIDWTLARHDPYPAIAVDRHWTMKAANRTAAMLHRQLGVHVGDNMLEKLIDENQMLDALENPDDVLSCIILRLRTESVHLGGDDFLDKAIAKLEAMVSPSAQNICDVMPAFLPVKYRAGDMPMSLISTFAQFGTAQDIALADLKIELMFPADDETKGVLEALGGQLDAW